MGIPPRLQPTFYNTTPHFFTTIGVNLPIRLEIFRVTHFKLNLPWNWRFQGVGANIFVPREHR